MESLPSAAVFVTLTFAAIVPWCLFIPFDLFEVGPEEPGFAEVGSAET
jgi:hypothetical protein